MFTFLTSEAKARAVAIQTGQYRYASVAVSVNHVYQHRGFLVDFDELRRWINRQLAAGNTFQVEIFEHASEGWFSY